MATPAIIHIEGSDIAVYAHWDGYPSHMLPWLTEFNKEFTEKRRFDPAPMGMKVAQLLRSSERDRERFNLDGSSSSGWSIIPTNEVMGAEFKYTLMADGSVNWEEIE